MKNEKLIAENRELQAVIEKSIKTGKLLTAEHLDRIETRIARNNWLIGQEYK